MINSVYIDATRQIEVSIPIKYEPIFPDWLPAERTSSG